MLDHFITVPHICADHLVHSLPYFPLPSVSPNIKSFFIESEYILCPKYSNLLIAFCMTNTNCCECSIKTADDGQ